MDRAKLAVVLLTGALALGACGERGEDGTSISISGDAADGKAHRASMDEGGKVKLDLPGFEGNFSLPSIQLTADTFDLNGVHLYPGSTIKDINVKAEGEGDGLVRIGFESPAGVAKVRGYLLPRLTKAGFKLQQDGEGLKGTTDDGEPFSMSLHGEGERSTGTIRIG